MHSNSDDVMLVSSKRERNDTSDDCKDGITKRCRSDDGRNIPSNQISSASYSQMSPDEVMIRDCYDDVHNGDNGDESRQGDPIRPDSIVSTQNLPDSITLELWDSSVVSSLSRFESHLLTRTSYFLQQELLPTPENISLILCRVDDRCDFLVNHSALDTLCGWMSNSRTYISRFCSSGCCSLMDEFYELAGIQRILQCLEFVHSKIEEEVYNESKNTRISYDDPLFMVKICFVLSCCSAYSQKHSQKILTRGGIESFISLNERYLDRVVLCSSSIESQGNMSFRNCKGSRKIEWEVIHGIWGVFESLLSQNIILQIGEARDWILDASLDTLEFLYGVEISHPVTPRVLCQVFAVLHFCLCRVSYQYITRTVCPRKILPKCLWILRDPATGDWREFSTNPEDVGEETALQKTAIRFLVDFVLLAQQQQEILQLEATDSHRLEVECDFRHVTRFGVEQIERAPSLALVQGAFALIFCLCTLPGEKYFLRYQASLPAVLRTLVESRDTETTLKNACDALIKYICD